MLKKINSFLTQSPIAAATLASSKKQRPELNDAKRSSDSAVDLGQLVNLPEPVQSSNSIKIYVSCDAGLYSALNYIRFILTSLRRWIYG